MLILAYFSYTFLLKAKYIMLILKDFLWFFYSYIFSFLKKYIFMLVFQFIHFYQTHIFPSECSICVIFIPLGWDEESGHKASNPPAPLTLSTNL